MGLLLFSPGVLMSTGYRNVPDGLTNFAFGNHICSPKGSNPIAVFLHTDISSCYFEFDLH